MQNDCIMIKRVYLSNEHYCTALNKMLCRTGDCSFYKSKEEYTRDFEGFVTKKEDSENDRGRI